MEFWSGSFYSVTKYSRISIIRIALNVVHLPGGNSLALDIEVYTNSLRWLRFKPPGRLLLSSSHEEECLSYSLNAVEKCAKQKKFYLNFKYLCTYLPSVRNVLLKQNVEIHQTLFKKLRRLFCKQCTRLWRTKYFKQATYLIKCLWSINLKKRELWSKVHTYSVEVLSTPEKSQKFSVLRTNIIFISQDK